MSYVRSNIDKFMPSCRGFEDDEVETMTAKEFDELPLSDQICVYNRFPEAYRRLTGKTVDDTATKDTPEPTPEDKAKAFCDAFERRVDDAIRRAFHPNEG